MDEQLRERLASVITTVPPDVTSFSVNWEYDGKAYSINGNRTAGMDAWTIYISVEPAWSCSLRP